jgi:hypothetical protein
MSHCYFVNNSLMSHNVIKFFINFAYIEWYFRNMMLTFWLAQPFEQDMHIFSRFIMACQILIITVDINREYSNERVST